MHAMDGRALRRLMWIVVGVAMLWSLLLVIALAFWGGDAFVDGIRSMAARLAFATLACFCGNHLLRFLRWHFMLRAEGHYVRWLRSLSVFLAGLALLPTPAKAGVAVRSLLLVREGVPIHVSLAAYFAERLLDLLGLVILATLLLGSGAPKTRLFAAFGVGLAGLALVAAAPALAKALRPRIAGRLQAVRVLDWTLRCFADAGDMLRKWRLLAFLLLGLVANAMTGVLLFAALRGTYIPIEIGAACGMVAVSHLSGSASLLPGGLGGFDLTLLSQLSAAGVSAKDALLGLAIVRIVTLWGSVAAGLPLLLVALLRGSIGIEALPGDGDPGREFKAP